MCELRGRRDFLARNWRPATSSWSRLLTRLLRAEECRPRSSFAKWSNQMTLTTRHLLEAQSSKKFQIFLTSTTEIHRRSTIAEQASQPLGLDSTCKRWNRLHRFSHHHPTCPRTWSSQSKLQNKSSLSSSSQQTSLFGKTLLKTSVRTPRVRTLIRMPSPTHLASETTSTRLHYLMSIDSSHVTKVPTLKKETLTKTHLIRPRRRTSKNKTWSSKKTSTISNRGTQSTRGWNRPWNSTSETKPSRSTIWRTLLEPKLKTWSNLKSLTRVSLKAFLCCPQLNPTTREDQRAVQTFFTKNKRTDPKPWSTTSLLSARTRIPETSHPVLSSRRNTVSGWKLQDRQSPQARTTLSNNIRKGPTLTSSHREAAFQTCLDIRRKVKSWFRSPKKLSWMRWMKPSTLWSLRTTTPCWESRSHSLRHWQHAKCFASWYQASEEDRTRHMEMVPLVSGDTFSTSSTRDPMLSSSTRRSLNLSNTWSWVQNTKVSSKTTSSRTTSQNFWKYNNNSLAWSPSRWLSRSILTARVCKHSSDSVTRWSDMSFSTLECLTKFASRCLSLTKIWPRSRTLLRWAARWDRAQ